MPAWLSPLLSALGWLASKLAFGWLIWRNGRLSVYRETADTTLKAKDRQLEAALNAPRTRDELVDRVRKSGLCLALAILLAGCASNLPSACPPVKQYDADFTAAFGEQLEQMPPLQYWAVIETLKDYYVLRRMAEACRNHA